jgi:hypothetical protein
MWCTLYTLKVAAAGGLRSKTKPLTLAEKKVKLWRLVKKAPEVMVKVSGGAKTTGHVSAHIDYITRKGELEVTTDHGDIVQGKEDTDALLSSWDLELGKKQGTCRQAFNIVLSMPKESDGKKVYAAAKAFAHENFWGEHQYMMVLHEDTKHPHVHLVIKAENNHGKRLYIRKATLQEWREHFAEKMREQGIEANATPRCLRGTTRKPKKTALYFTEKRGDSTVLKSKLSEIEQELLTGDNKNSPWESRIIAHRQSVINTLLIAAKEMKQSNENELSVALVNFARQLPKLETERHTIKQQLIEGIEKEQPLALNAAKENNQHKNEMY